MKSLAATLLLVLMGCSKPKPSAEITWKLNTSDPVDSGIVYFTSASHCTMRQGYVECRCPPHELCKSGMTTADMEREIEAINDRLGKAYFPPAKIPIPKELQ